MRPPPPWRRRRLADDDRAFIGLLLWWGLIAGLLLAVPEQPPNLGEPPPVPHRLAVMLIPSVDAPPSDAPEPPSPPATPAPAPELLGRSGDRTLPADPSERAMVLEARKRQLLESVPLLRGYEGLLVLVDPEGEAATLARLAAALDGIEGGDLEAGLRRGGLRGGAEDRRDWEIGGATAFAVGDADVIAVAAVPPRSPDLARMLSLSPRTPPIPAAALGPALPRIQRDVRACLARAGRPPTGRFELVLSVEDGVVDTVDVTTNRTGLPNPQPCLDVRRRLWRLAAGVTGQARLPMVFAGG